MQVQYVTCKFVSEMTATTRAATTAIPNPRSRRHREVDARVGHDLIEVKFGVDALRTLRTSLMQVAYPLGEDPAARGFVVLADSPITAERLREEWSRAAAILRRGVLGRLSICLFANGRFTGIPHDPDAATQRTLAKVVAAERAKTGGSRTDYAFVVTKILLHHWLAGGEPVTTEWLARTAGCSYPSVARVLVSLGSLIERTSDRRVRLRWFRREAFARLLAWADRARSTVRFANRSGQPRSTDFHLRRLEQLNLLGLAIGGVLGAKHLFPELDLVGTPRLDLSLHCPDRPLDLGFVTRLDPALERVTDPLAPADLVVHALRHADPLFTPRAGGLAWADPVECLLDLHEAHLETPAIQFLDHLQTKAKARQNLAQSPDDG